MEPRLNRLIQTAFGWNAQSWANPFLRAVEENGISIEGGLKILELGAGRLSAVSLLFTQSDNEITITAYTASNLTQVDDLIHRFRETHRCQATLASCKMSALDVQGTYDLIILKSVLGGIFRVGQDIGLTPENLLQHIVRNNLAPGGHVISCDNGRTVLEPLYGRFGARAKGWQMFRPQDFSQANTQHVFGVFSGFSFSSRLGTVGRWIDAAFYGVERVLSTITQPHAPAIIVSTYKAPS